MINNLSNNYDGDVVVAAQDLTRAQLGNQAQRVIRIHDGQIAYSGSSQPAEDVQ